MHRKLTFFVLALLTISILGSAYSVKGQEETRTVTDMLGREVEIPKEIDEIVGIEAGALRLLTYMNATDMVVGVEQFEKSDSNRPYIMANPELQEKESIGPQHGGDPELITAQQPDVIFWTYTTVGEADDLQQKTGIPVIGLKYGDLDDKRKTFYDALDMIGDVLEREERAEELKDFFDGTIKDLNERTKDIPEEEKPTCYVGGIGFKGPHGIKSTEPDYSPFQFLNARNVANGLNMEHAMVDPEQIIQWDPEVLFVDEGGYKLVMSDLKNSSEYKQIDAIKNSEVYGVLPYNYYTANYGTILANAYYIGSVLYQEQFEDIDIEEKADRIYEELVGEEVYSQMNGSFGGYKELDAEINSDGDRSLSQGSFYLPLAVVAASCIVSISYYWKRKRR